MALAALTTVLSVQPSVTASVYTRDEWERLLPGCDQADNLWDAAQCILQNSPTQCVSMSTPGDLVQCFTQEFEWNDQRIQNHTGIVRDVLDTALHCFDPYHDCIAQRVEAALAGLPECVGESSMALAQCFLDNAPKCLASCAGAVWDGDSPFEDLNIFDLFSCDGIERNLLEPMCEVVSCCEPCLQPLEAVAECVVNDVLDFGLWRDCDFTCDYTPPNRELRAAVSSQSTTASQEQQAQHVYEACRARTPGLLGTDHPSRRLAARSDFFDCILHESLGLYHYSSTSLESSTTTTAPPPAPAVPATPAPMQVVLTQQGSNEGNDGGSTPQLSANSNTPSAAAHHVMMATTGMVMLWTASIQLKYFLLKELLVNTRGDNGKTKNDTER